MAQFGKEEIRNLTQVIESTFFADKRGGFMDQLRNDFCKIYGTKHAICASTAMLLMHAIPSAMEIGAGDEIICDPMVPFHALACLHNNVIPVWADVRADDFLMDPAAVEKRITKRTKAIWVTHLFSYPAEVDTLRRIADKHKIYLIEDVAHGVLAKYKGKYLGTFGHVGTFSFNMYKQLPTGEGGIAVLNDDKLAFEINRRIIFGEAPEVLSSNYRMTEFQAAVGVAQLKKVPGYIRTFLQGKKILDEAIRGCQWLKPRTLHKTAKIAPYLWSCLFHGEEQGIDYAVFKAAVKQAGGHFNFGFNQVPFYMYDVLRKPVAYGNKGCPYNCHLYKGKVDWRPGLCPVAEDTMPRIMMTHNMDLDLSVYRKKAETIKKAIALTESGKVKPLEYDETEKKILKLVKEHKQLEPIEVANIFDQKGWPHFEEQVMIRMMEDLRGRYPYRLSKAGPRKYAYNELK